MKLNDDKWHFINLAVKEMMHVYVLNPDISGISRAIQESPLQLKCLGIRRLLSLSLGNFEVFSSFW